MNTLNQQDAFNEMRKETKNDSIFYWILQIITPIAVIGLLISVLLSIPPVIFIIVYVISFIFQLCHPSFSYLLNRHHEISIYEKMKSIFSSVPTIKFNCVCFHMENIIEKKTDDKGKVTETKRTEKKITYTGSKQFQYYCVRDMSGLFKLDIPNAYMNRKAFIKLHLDKEINFADPVSFYDYKLQKENFWNENKMRDNQIEITESRDIPNFSSYNLVKIGNYDPEYIGVLWYLLFTFIPVTQFYRNYFDSLCIEQNFKIRKLLSTRYNLNDRDNSMKYNAFNPSLSVNDQRYFYDNQNTGYVFNNVQVDYPTLDEINKASQYDSNIPKYNIYSNGFQAGVVQEQNFNNGYYDIPAPNASYSQ